MNINVEGRQLTSPINDFGQMWQKTYRMRMTDPGITPQQLIQIWKSNEQQKIM